MLRSVTSGWLPVALLTATACGAPGRSFIELDAPIVAMTHARVIDGTGAAAVEGQTLVIADGHIAALGPSETTPVPSTAQVLDVSGQTVLPGFVGMHEHLFYQISRPDGSPRSYAARSAFAKLYLAAGVTTIRTAGTSNLEGDLRLRRRIEEGAEPGPHIDATGRYLNAQGRAPNPEAIARMVNEDAERGATSFKAYTSLRSDELEAAIEAAHARGLRVTGHLCAVGYRKAAALGIDNIEHGLVLDSELYPDKQPDQCPGQSQVLGAALGKSVSDADVRRIISDLVRRGVAVTSTLAVLESATGRESTLDPRVPMMLAPRLRDAYQEARESTLHSEARRSWGKVLDLEMAFERAFVAAGGRLLAGVDPTGWGGVIAGFGDQRELELLVEAGFAPEAAIRIATSNGASFLWNDEIGTIASGKRADLVVVRGNPSVEISDVRHVEIVFKDGIGYDPDALVDAARGAVGGFEFDRLRRWPWNAAGIIALLLVARIAWRFKRPSQEVRV